MSELALYRKYRPSQWKDVLGQEQVTTVLESSVKEGNISHAYLFSGSRGTGKTSVARILARAIGTSERDLYEIDAASNRGIDDIRTLREEVATLPFESPRKVYIIDEAHMLTKEAWNAFLKTLEEPPKHVVFIFATTELQKVPETIISRCLTFSFKKPTGKLLADLLTAVAKKENATIDKPAAELLAYLGDGSYRDAYGMLEKAIAAAGKKTISRELIEEVTGAPKAALVNRVLTGIAAKDAAEALRAVTEARENNIDSVLFLKLILEKTRAVMLLTHAPALKKDIETEYSAEDFSFLESLSRDKKINSAVLVELLAAAELTARSSIASLPLEIALVKICSAT